MPRSCAAFGVVFPCGSSVRFHGFYPLLFHPYQTEESPLLFSAGPCGCGLWLFHLTPIRPENRLCRSFPSFWLFCPLVPLGSWHLPVSLTCNRLKNCLCLLGLLYPLAHCEVESLRTALSSEDHWNSETITYDRLKNCLWVLARLSRQSCCETRCMPLSCRSGCSRNHRWS